MKSRFCPSLLILFLLSGACFAQAPRPALGTAGSNELSADFVLPVKGSNLSDAGYGGQIASIHFFGEHVGITAQGDYERTNFFEVREEAARVGPIVRFATKQSVQPYLEILGGYSRVKAAYLATTSYYGSASAMAGGGFDYRVSGPWYVKAGADLEYDMTPQPHRTRFVRGILGFSYRFGVR